MPKAIQDNNNLYNLLSPLVQFGTRCHYQTFVVRGRENLPTDGAYIIAPCHQQALMEPLAVLNFAPKPPVFLARADIFAQPTVRAILTFLKILPVYRIRDGRDNLSKNDAIFEKSRNVLLDGYPLCLMAEGRHNDRHQLLPLVKGMFRIAGETQRKLGDYPLYIVPTGIDFDNYERPYANLVVNIGKPIAVQPFMATFESNEPVALNQMREALTQALLPQMHDIRSKEHYDEIYTLCRALNKRQRKASGWRNSAWNRFRVRQMLSNKYDAMEREGDGRFETLMARSRDYAERCRKLHFSVRTVPERWSLLATLAALLGVAGVVAAMVAVPAVRWVVLFLLLCFPMPFLPTHHVTQKIIKDPQFRSSINFGIRFFLTIIYTIVIAIVVACNDGLWMSRLADIGPWWGLVVVGLVHLEAMAAASVVNGLKAVLRNSRYWLLRLFRPKAMRDLEACLDAMAAEK